MHPLPTLTSAHQRTYQTIFRHPLAHNLGWHDVFALFRELGQVDEEANGNFKVSRHGQVLVVPAIRAKDVAGDDELLKIRDFLTRSETTPVDLQPQDARWLVVINHHEARIFRSMADAAVAELIRPEQTDDAISHVHRFNGFSRGQEKPAAHSFFGPVADGLRDAAAILICGGSTGSANEMDQFVAWLKTHRPDLARRIVGALLVDEHHLTDAQLLAKARAFFSLPRAPALAPS